jgi:hypothetical protein
MNEQTDGRPRVAANRDEPESGEGLVEVKSSRSGEALLRDETGTVWRLPWSSSPTRPFALPTGTYTWVTYRLIEEVWHVSVTGQLATIEVKAGRTAPLEVRDGIKIRLRGAPRPSGVQAEAGLSGPERGGLSLYRDGRRVALTCQIFDESGGELGSALLRYG